jgi:hypothetical protein
MSSGPRDGWPVRDTSACVWTSIAVSCATSMRAGAATSVSRRPGRGDAEGLGLRTGTLGDLIH